MSEAGAYAATQACPTCGTRGQIREQVQLVCGACEDTIIAVPRADPTAIASESLPVLSATDAMLDAIEGQNLYHGRHGTTPAGRATALAILSGLRDRGFDLAERSRVADLLAAVQAADDILDANPTEDACRHGNDVFFCDEPDGCADRSRRELIRDAATETPDPLHSAPEPQGGLQPTWPSRDDIAAMTRGELNAFLASRGLDVRVAAPPSSDADPETYRDDESLFPAAKEEKP